MQLLDHKSQPPAKTSYSTLAPELGDSATGLWSGLLQLLVAAMFQLFPSL